MSPGTSTPSPTQKQDILRMLYEATSGRSGTFSERMAHLFALGHEVLGLRVGILSRIVGDRYEVLEASAPADFDLGPGATFELGDTYCRDVLAADGPIGFSCASGSDWASHPCYLKLGLESYFGVPVHVEGRVHGTLNFSDPDPRQPCFEPFHAELLRLMARWVGVEIERSRSEEELERSNHLLRMVSHAQAEFILHADVRELFDRLLNDVLRLTKSEYGFIGELLREADGTKYLKTHAITNIAWSEETQRFYEDNAPSGLVFRNLQSLFGACLVSEAPVISNSPDQDSRSCGRPPGHPDLRCFLGLPILAGNEMIGMMGIANRPGGYDDEVCEFLRPFLTTCGSVISTYHNDQHRKAAEDALRESEARSHAVLQAAADGIVTITDEGMVESFNPAAEEIFGCTADEIVGNNVSKLMPDPYASEHDGYLRRYAERESSWIIGKRREVVGKRKGGAEFPLELTVTEIGLGDRRLFTGIVRDITERKRAEGELRSFAEKVESTNRELSEFTYVASHDLQEPLRKLISFSRLLEKDLGDDLPEAAQADLNFIVDAARRMQNLVSDLLVLSRAGSAPIDRVPTPLSDCVDRAVQALAMRLEETGAVIERDELPTVRGDATLLAQLYQNLIGNAVKFAADRTPHVHITAEYTADSYWIFGVKDNGIGIKRDYAEHVFEPFKRLHGRTSYDGTGIGLAICRKAVKRHGGRIWVESTPGEGSHFKFTIGT